MKKINKVLVTGGCGFIGSHIVDELLKKGIETYVIDNLSTGRLNNLSHILNDPLLHLIKGDISQIQNTLKSLKDLDIVFHEAAISSVPKSIRYPNKVFHTNTASSIKVINFCLNNGVEKIVFASSSAVYGDANSNVLVEESLCRPTSPYGSSKLAIENFLYSYWKTYGLKSVSLRYFNVYGTRQRNSGNSGVIPIFVHRLSNNLPLTVYGDGSQIRDFVNIRDVVDANILSMDSERAVGEVINIGTGVPTNIIEIIRLIKKIINIDNYDKIEFGKERIGDINRSLSSITRAKTILGYSPKVKLSTGLQTFIKEYLSSK